MYNPHEILENLRIMDFELIDVKGPPTFQDFEEIPELTIFLQIIKAIHDAEYTVVHALENIDRTIKYIKRVCHQNGVIL